MDNTSEDQFIQHLKDLNDLQSLVSRGNTYSDLKRISEYALTTYLYGISFLLIKIEEEEIEIIACSPSLRGKSIPLDSMLPALNQVQPERQLQLFTHELLEWCNAVICPNQNASGKFLLLIEQPKGNTILHQFLVNIASTIMIGLENIKLQEEKLKEETKKAVLETQLNLAKEIQSKLLPTKFLESNLISIETFYKPHFSVGGDYYDWVQNEDSSYVILADVAGKGVSASLIMSGFQAYFRVLAAQQLDLKDLVNQLNTYVMNLTKGERFISACIIKIIGDSLEYINAGHLPPLMNTRSGVKELTDGCPVLGMLPDLPFILSANIHLERNEQILLYTDGLTEVWNNKEEMLPDEFLPEFLLKASNINCQSIYKAIQDYSEAKGFLDDVTLLIISRA